jgi:hypothetical protein
MVGGVISVGYTVCGGEDNSVCVPENSDDESDDAMLK